MDKRRLIYRQLNEAEEKELAMRILSVEKAKLE
jgi:hypothetical protein